MKGKAWNVPWNVLLRHGIPEDLTDADAEAETAKIMESVTQKMVSPRAFSLFKPVKQRSDELVPELALKKED